MFCPNCGNHIPENAAVCPYCRMRLAQPVVAAPTGARKALPIIALCCGVVGTALGGGGYISSWFKTFIFEAPAAGTSMPVLLVSCLLGLAAIVCGIIGLVRSIRTGGKKYVTGIVLSAIGIYFGLNALSVALMSLLMSGMSGIFDQDLDVFFDL